MINLTINKKAGSELFGGAVGAQVRVNKRRKTLSLRPLGERRAGVVPVSNTNRGGLKLCFEGRAVDVLNFLNPGSVTLENGKNGWIVIKSCDHPGAYSGRVNRSSNGRFLKVSAAPRVCEAM